GGRCLSAGDGLRALQRDDLPEGDPCHPALRARFRRLLGDAQCRGVACRPTQTRKVHPARRTDGWLAIRGASDTLGSCGVKVRDAIKRLTDEGWYLSTTKDSHRQFKHPT